MRGRAKRALETSILFAFDIAALLFLFFIAYYLRTDVLPQLYAGFPPKELLSRNPLSIWWVLVIWFFFFSYEGLYTRRLSFWDEVKSLCKTSLLSSVGVFAIISIGKLSPYISRTMVVLMGLMGVVLLPVLRMGLKGSLRRLGLLKRRVLILGAGETGKLISRALAREPNFGYEVIGYLDDDPAKVGSRLDGVKVHRGVDNAERYLKQSQIADLIIAMPGAGKERLKELINRYQHSVDRVLLVPDLFGMAVAGTTLQHFFDEQAFALDVKNNLARPVNIIVKRLFDWLLGLVLFVLLAMPMLLLALVIRLTSRGPAIYRQQRIGKQGKAFLCWKFRTMYGDAESRLREILSADPEAKEEWEQYYKLKDDPRVTPIGRFLRRTSLDELPQLLNVMRGEMSLVGPRPVTEEEIGQYYKDDAPFYFSVLPGITGLWQTSGRSNTSYEQRISLDSWYVRNWDLWLDIVILLRTLRVVARREGAR
jgi:undecaprenyl-phosphate galactose phosphotransferase